MSDSTEEQSPHELTYAVIRRPNAHWLSLVIAVIVPVILPFSWAIEFVEEPPGGNGYVLDDEILEAVKKGVDAPLVVREQVKRPSDAILKRLEKLKNWRKTRAKEMSVESDVILPKVYLNSLAEHPPKNMEELKAILAESPWRFEHYGSQIFRIVGG